MWGGVAAPPVLRHAEGWRTRSFPVPRVVLTSFASLFWFFR